MKRATLGVALVLAACTTTPKEVEYVSSTNADGTPWVIDGVRATIRVRFQIDTANRTVAMRARVFRGDSLLGTEINTLPEGEGQTCTIFGAASWTCGENGHTWTFDSNELRLIDKAKPGAMILRPQPVTTP